MRLQTRRWPAAFVLALSLALAGCSFAPALRTGDGVEHWNTTVPAQFQPDLVRFQNELGMRVPQEHVDSERAEMKLVASAFGAMVNNYVDPLDPVTLIDAAIGGMDDTSDSAKPRDADALVEAAITAMVSAVDQDSAYLNPELFQELQVDTRDKFGSAGLEITMRNGTVTIVAPIEGGPAARAGLRSGDQLFAIDGVSTEGANLVQTVRRLRGPVGTDVVLTIRRDGASELLTPTITREVILLRSVTFQRTDETYGYIRISQFNQGTDASDRDALSSLQRDGPLSGLVLDLRNNPGGLFTQAVKVADVFLDDGVVVQTKGRVQRESRVFHARQATDWGRIPMVILVNRGTAAGSEIVAAALRAHKRAALVGAPTFGRGTIQTIIPIGDQAALRLTTSRAYSPTGSSFDGAYGPTSS